MLKDVKQTKIAKEEYKARIKEYKVRLSSLQQQMKQQRLPVMVVFEGWGASGKGGITAKVIQDLDPRTFRVYSTTAATEWERRYHFMQRFFEKIPAYGELSILDRSWYRELSTYAVEEGCSDKVIHRRMEEVEQFEKQLTDDGYLILKFFLHISQKEQRKRFDRLLSDPSTAWRVSREDEERNDDYDVYYNLYNQLLNRTNYSFAPWHAVGGEDRRAATLAVYETLLTTIEAALEQKKHPTPDLAIDAPVAVSTKYDRLAMPALSTVALDCKITKADYEKQLDRLQKRLSELHGLLYLKKIPVIIGYEGWDAAGKGGNIKRVASALDPRGYTVFPIAAPDSEELRHHYLWRFWKRLPRTGHIAIFDRTWYGRVMVERIEGFCSSACWHRAFEEMNLFEKQLADNGAIVLKFWIHIDKDEQLRRFEDRQNTPEKQWKITEEDWRNREKWDAYEVAVDEMLQHTSTTHAPWHIIESQDKRYARIKVLQILIDTIEKRLEE